MVNPLGDAQQLETPAVGLFSWIGQNGAKSLRHFYETFHLMEQKVQGAQTTECAPMLL